MVPLRLYLAFASGFDSDPEKNYFGPGIFSGQGTTLTSSEGYEAQ
jgi:hypothetical protein